MGTLAHILGQRASRDVEHFGIFLHGMYAMEVLLQELAESHEGTVGDARHIELRHFPSLTTALYPYQEEAHKVLHVVLVGEGSREGILAIHLVHQEHQAVSLLVRNLAIWQGVVGIEDIILQEDTLARFLVCHKTGIEVDDDSLIVVGTIEGMHLPWSDEEDGIVRNGIVSEIDVMHPVTSAEPNDLVKLMRMGHHRSRTIVGKEPWHELEFQLKSRMRIFRNRICSNVFLLHCFILFIFSLRGIRHRSMLVFTTFKFIP